MVMRASGSEGACRPVTGHSGLTGFGLPNDPAAAPIFLLRAVSWPRSQLFPGSMMSNADIAAEVRVFILSYDEYDTSGSPRRAIERSGAVRLGVQHSRFLCAAALNPRHARG